MTHSKETMKKARELLEDMAALADDQPFNITHTDYVMRMWNAFNKGRRYGDYVLGAEAKEDALQTVLKTIDQSDLKRCIKAVFNA